MADFGLSCLHDQYATSRSHDGLTYPYAAPETFRRHVSEHSDQYSLAVTYCVLRGGRLPFVGPPANVMLGHLFEPPDLSMLPEPEQPIVAAGPGQERSRALAGLPPVHRDPGFLSRGGFSRDDPGPGRRSGRRCDQSLSSAGALERSIVTAIHRPADRLVSRGLSERVSTRFVALMLPSHRRCLASPERLRRSWL